MNSKVGTTTDMAIESQAREQEEENVMFKDFTEPDLMKTGYLIPLNCGHNGQYSLNEKTIYELHLTNAGFIQEDNDEEDEYEDD